MTEVCAPHSGSAGALTGAQAKSDSALGRRQFLKGSLAIGAAALASRGVGSASPRKVVVGAHGWVYAAPMPEYDYTPKLEQIFSD